MYPLLQDNYTEFLYLSAPRIRFLCSIAEEYEFISPAPAIFYDPVTYQPTLLIDRLHQEYRADFLIRHRRNGDAFLLDLHPACLADDRRLKLRRNIAEGYIEWKGLDWQYRCLYQEYIQLKPVDYLLFNLWSVMRTNDDRHVWLKDYTAMLQLMKPAAFQYHEYSLLDFLIHGVLPVSI